MVDLLHASGLINISLKVHIFFFIDGGVLIRLSKAAKKVVNLFFEHIIRNKTVNIHQIPTRLEMSPFLAGWRLFDKNFRSSMWIKIIAIFEMMSTFLL